MRMEVKNQAAGHLYSHEIVMLLSATDDLLLEAACLRDDHVVQAKQKIFADAVAPSELGGPGLDDADALRLHHRHLVGFLEASDVLAAVEPLLDEIQQFGIDAIQPLSHGLEGVTQF
jgi:hypothetical protein